ncbi:MAG: haloacid dehalogenase type II, partial [Beijerinckiaceae bacterium]|nr:haloacid dehalogenase type II [Beijerinckiaceae bacterium]
MNHDVYAFDAYGTLFDVHSAVAAMRTRIGPDAARLSDMWRTKQLEYTWVRTLAGEYCDFMALTGQALDFAASQCGGIAADVRADLLKSYETLDAYADVKPVLQTLRDSGARTAILSNGTPAMLAAAVKAAGIAHLLDHTISVDSLARYKTVPEVYAMVTQITGVEAGNVSFQSSNRWDIAGASKFGFRCVWVNRTGQPDEYLDMPPDHVVSSLSE